MSLDTDSAVLPSLLRRALEQHRMMPLWDSPNAHGKAAIDPNPGQIWRWSEMRPILAAVSEVTSPRVQERRVLSLLDHRAKYAAGEATVGTVNATLQTLLPGERARPHRHTIDALRFVLESQGGAKTIVDGKHCPMEPGDLVLTPGWCWHEHVHEGEGPVFWLDVLDVALRRFFDVEVFQPGPVVDAMPQVDDALFASPAIVPITALPQRGFSPVFRYPWADAAAAVMCAPVGPDGSRKVRYANPLTGGASMQLLDSLLMQLDPGTITRLSRTSAHTVCCVVEGSGRSEVGGQSFDWAPKDVFTLPANTWARHQATTGPARIFQASNREVFARLGVLTEEVGDQP